MDEAFRKLRHSFALAHPGWKADHSTRAKISTETKSVTPPPGTQDTQNLLQLSNGVEHRRHAKSTVAALNSTDDVLFAVWTDSLFYDTRLAGILETWGSEIPPDRFMAISDKKRPGNTKLPGSDVQETRCPPHSHWEGACCKWAEGVISAQERMEKNPSLKWAFFSDDDVYLLPSVVTAALHAEDHEADANRPQALGYFGCQTPTGCQGLCGGGGFAMNRAAVQRLAGTDPTSFLVEEMAYCSKCQWWADQAISMIWRDKGIEMKQLPGLNGWVLKEDDFKKQLAMPNLLFHYQRTKHQMEALHEIFTGKKLLTQENGPCVEYKGHKTCAASNDPYDVPFLGVGGPMLVPAKVA